ncbi:ABC transporter substrate-binding protein [Apibacter raozihei]|uniref:ABC transporter substrate-binding protein n=1 Tax=Apibacter raozihei TaxID=2500547 RepID=UPI000FE33FDB|nr:ABC transporter substrate-binding protein [Apibacter raozihei]
MTNTISVKYKFLALIIAFTFFSCKKSNNHISENLKNEYAKNYSIQDKNDQIEIYSAGEKVLLPVNFKLTKCVITHTSASAYIQALGKLHTIAGVCSPHYFYNTEINAGIVNRKIQDIGNDAGLNFEKIMAIRPDIIFTTHNHSYEKVLNQLKKQGIKVIYIEEYLELHPLGKTEYLKLFGRLYSESAKADSLYNKIKNNYITLKNKVEIQDKKPSVLTGMMYGDTWYMAGGKSFIAELFKDAGADYIWKDNSDSGSIPLSFEEVFSKAKNADYWIGASNYSTKKEMLASNSNYEWFDAYKNNRIYIFNKRENKLKANDYYESGTLYADRILADIIKILHPQLIPEYQFEYIKKLE